MEHRSNRATPIAQFVSVHLQAPTSTMNVCIIIVRLLRQREALAEALQGRVWGRCRVELPGSRTATASMHHTRARGSSVSLADLTRPCPPSLITQAPLVSPGEALVTLHTPGRRVLLTEVRHVHQKPAFVLACFESGGPVDGLSGSALPSHSEGCDT